MTNKSPEMIVMRNESSKNHFQFVSKTWADARASQLSFGKSFDPEVLRTEGLRIAKNL